MTEDVGPDGDGDDLVTLVMRASSFEAHATAARLEEHDVRAWVFDSFDQFGVPMSHGRVGVPVQVRHADVDRARAVLETAGGLKDIDWSDVDVGDREDDIPLRTPGRMPLGARGAFFIALIVALVALLVAVAVIFGP